MTFSLRPDGRKPAQLRPVQFELDVAPAAKGSALVSMGNTRIICAVTVDEAVPRWMREQKMAGGWLTAEYSLLPYSTDRRTSRESSLGKIGGRTQEIQRLVGRALRAVTDLRKLGSRTVWVDCDVLQADGGTRTAAITGAYVALKMAMEKLCRDGVLETNPLTDSVAAVSVGLAQNRPLLDLCYAEDVAADVDMNIVMTGSGKFVEIQGTAEHQLFTSTQHDALLNLACRGIRQLLAAQRKALKEAG